MSEKIKKVKLGDICEIFSGYAFKEFNSEQKGLPVLKIANILSNGQIDTTNTQYSEEKVNSKFISKLGDLLIAMSGATTGKAAIVDTDKPFYINQRVGIVRLKEGVTIPIEYVRFLLNYRGKAILEKAFGCAQPNISPNELKEIAFYAGDARFINKETDNLLRVTNLIQKRKQQLEKLDELIKSKYAEMFGDPLINEKKFPVLTVNDVMRFQGGSQPDKRFFEYEKTDGNVRLIQIRDYKTDRYVTYIPKSMVKRYCYADDIMIGRYGPPIFQILRGIEGAYNVALMKVIPKMGNKEFVRQFLKQDCLLHYLEGLSKRTAGQDGIQMDKLKQYPFPYPPIELQNQFADFVERIEAQKAKIKQSLNQLEVLKKSLMQKYFG